DRFANPREPFWTRRAEVVDAVRALGRLDVLVVPHRLINNEAELLDYERVTVDAGFEGLILRDPNGPYKYGRSTAREGWMLKLKRFKDSEAEVIGVEEEMHNGNEAKVNALGLTERS